MVDDYPQLLDHIIHLGIALAIGLLVGSERGWHHRTRSEGTRVAGIRTFTLIALYGGLTATLATVAAQTQALLLCVLAFLPLSLLLIAGYFQAAREQQNLSITTEVAAMLTFWLGAMPQFKLALPATACAVVLAVLLHLKDRLHHWLKVVDEKELLGTLQFLLVSLVLLPLLPNRDFGPWQSFNPYKIWWMVVLISGLSLVGYFAMRLAGSRNGILATSLTGGLVSSTGVTLSLSKLHREVGDTRLVSAGILLACATMYARMLVVVFVIGRDMVLPLLPALAVGFIVLAAVAIWQLKHTGASTAEQPIEVRNPFELVPALQFGGLLALVMVGAEVLQAWFGQAGLYGLSLATGIADVDAIVLSLVPGAGVKQPQSVVVLCVALAAASNTVMKGVYCRLIAGPALGYSVLGPLILTAVAVLITGFAG